MENILALHIGHDATALLIDDKSFVAISEERVTRIKNYFGFPLNAAEKLLKEKKINWSEIDKILITSKSIKNSRDYKNFFFFNFINHDFCNEIGLSVRLKFVLNFLKRNKTFDFYLKEFLSKKNYNGKILYLDHHLCHIASSLAMYPFRRSYLLSLDGGGDNINWSFYSYRNQNLKLLENSMTFYQNKKICVHDTPADVYANTAKFLGFRRLRDEGKIMGLSASGKPKYFKYFDNLLIFEKGRFISKLGSQDRPLLQKIKNFFNLIIFGLSYDNVQVEDMKNNIKKNFKKEDICCSLQKWCEKISHKFFDYLSEKYNFNNEKILLSGGFFSNVLINQKIKERRDIDNVYVVPNMSDGGLVLGAIYHYLSNQEKKKFFGSIAKNTFFGLKPEIFNISKNNYKRQKLEKSKLSNFVAQNLIKNKIVGIINDRMEFGPRALGNRSILANPTKKNITKILNRRLKRSDFMPFAPMIRDVDAKKILENYSSEDYSSRFMTITYNVKQKYHEKLRNILHLDNTFRVQIIDKIENQLCYEILTNFFKKSGIPCIINTSFNVHDDPIVMSINDAIKALNHDVIDLLVADNEVITKK